MKNLKSIEKKVVEGTSYIVFRYLIVYCRKYIQKLYRYIIKCFEFDEKRPRENEINHKKQKYL